MQASIDLIERLRDPSASGLGAARPATRVAERSRTFAVPGAEETSIFRSALLAVMGELAAGGSSAEAIAKLPRAERSVVLDARLPKQLLDAWFAQTEAARWWDRWLAGGDRLLEFLARLEARSGVEGLARLLVTGMEREALATRPGPSTLHLLRVAAMPLDWGLWRRGVVLPARLELVALRPPGLRPRRSPKWWLPVREGVVASVAVRRSVLRQPRAMGSDARRAGLALAKQLLRPALRGLARAGFRGFAAAAAPLGVILHGRRLVRRASSGAEPDRAVSPTRRALGTTGTEAAPREPDRREPDRRAGWDAFFSSKVDPYGYGDAYERLKGDHLLEMLGPAAPHALELGCAEGHLTQRLATVCAGVTGVDVSSVALRRAAERCGGRDDVRFECVDIFQEPVGRAWPLIVASEVLYYAKDRGQLRRTCRKLAGALREGGRLVAVHAFVVSEEPSRSGMDWTTPFGAAGVRETLRTIPGLRWTRTLETELYAVDEFVRCDKAADPAPPLQRRARAAPDLPLKVARHVLWRGAVRTRRQVEARAARRLPVLMYHRIASDGPSALRPWRVSASAFEAQMSFLHRRGYYTVRPADWRRCVERGGDLPGRPVIVTFDDAYTDFAEVALPILERHGFSAHLFVPVDRLGRNADWDAHTGPAAPLMTWAQLEGISDRISIGSHLCTHRRVDTLSPAEFEAEARLSKMRLERRVGGPIDTVAPPFGVITPWASEILSDLGYRQQFLATGGVSRFRPDAWMIPRLDVDGLLDLHAFAQLIERSDEPPEPADLPCDGAPPSPAEAI